MSYVTDLVLSSVIKSRISNRDSYRRYVEMALDFYYGRQIVDSYGNYYHAMEGENPAVWKARKNFFFTVNITQMIIDKLASGTFDQACERSARVYSVSGEVLQHTEQDSETETETTVDDQIDAFGEWQKVVDSESYSAKIQEANAMRLLLGQVWCNPQWIESASILDPKIRLVWWTPDQVLTKTSKEDPETLRELVAYFYRFEPGDTKPIRVEWRWTPERYEYLEDGKVVSFDNKPGSGQNPYGEIPFIQFRYLQEFGRGDIEADGLMSELIPANIQINKLLTQINVIAYCQAAGIPVFTNVKDAPTALNMFNTIQLLPASPDMPPDFKFIVPSADLEKIIHAAEVLCASIFNRFWLANSQPIQLSLSSPESGIAKWIKDADVRKFQLAQRLEMRRFESALAKTICRVASVGLNGGIAPEIAEKRIAFFFDYGEPLQAMTLTEQVQTDDLMLANGSVNEIDLELRRNPDLKTRQEALNVLVERETEKEKIRYLKEKRLSDWRRETLGIQPPEQRRNRFVEGA